MVSGKNLKVSQKRCLGTSIESFTGSSPSEQIIQFGFRQKHSTTHALTSLAEKIKQSINKGNYGCGVFIDLKNAFDTVNHFILLKKLEHYGVRCIPLQWFRPYLSGRKQYISVVGNLSKTLEISYGVPQGFALGPLLFLLYSVFILI